MCLLGIYVSLKKSLFRTAHFLIGFLVFLILSFMSYLYALEINHLLVDSSENIFSHSMGCLFILFMVSFAVQKFINLPRSHLLKSPQFLFLCHLIF